jgi:hypothetical protein
MKPDLHYDERVEEGFRWADLQLPLYRFIAEARGVTGIVALGYFNLPADAEDANGGVQIAQWDEAALARAVEERDQVIRCIRGQHFWPPGPPSMYADGLERICADNVIDRDRKIEIAGAGEGEARP